MKTEKDVEWESERFASTFEANLWEIPLDWDEIHEVMLNITIKHKGYTPFECTYIRTLKPNDLESLSYHENRGPVPTDASGKPLRPLPPRCPQPTSTPEAHEISDEDLQVFDAVISDPETNRNFIHSLKKARNAKDVAEAVLRLVKKGAIDENRASRKCFAERILSFCTFQKGISETNISNTIRNLLTEKHHEIKQTLQQANVHPEAGTSLENENTNL